MHAFQRPACYFCLVKAPLLCWCRSWIIQLPGCTSLEWVTALCSYMCKYLHPFPSHLVKHSIFVQYKVLCIQKKTHCLVGRVCFEGALCLFNRRPDELQHAFCGVVLLSSSFTAGLADLWRGDGLLQGQTLNQWLGRTSGPTDSSALFKSSST